MQRLEQKLSKENEKTSTVQTDVERLRTQKVDDALLIDRLKGSLDTLRDSLNELIGVLSSYQGYLDSMDNHNPSKAIATLYEQISSLKPMKSQEDMAQCLNDIKSCVVSLISHTKSLRKKEAYKSISDSPP